MHTSRLLAESEFDRHLIYFTKDFFTINGSNTPITNFMDHVSAGSLKLSHTAVEELIVLLKKIEQALHSNQPYKELLVNAHLVELFALINNEEAETVSSASSRDHATKVKQYIDSNFATIHSVNEIAEHFFYSREYLSRIFKTAFNISVAQYLSRKRILESLPLISKLGAINAGLAVGFHNYQSFINTFKKVMGCLPSEYIRGN
jgi:AraC-like DNA-binding protein